MSTLTDRRPRVAAAALALVVGAGSLVAGAAPAAASATCAFDAATATMVIALPADGDVVPVFTESNGDISFDYRLCLDGATPATVTNTDQVVVTGGAGRQEITLDLSGGPLAPGVTDEPGSSDEIEVSVDLGGAADDRVILYGSFAADHYRVTDTGVNLNATEADGVDLDLTLTGVNILDVFASRGPDVVDASGYSTTVNLYGQADADVLTGGLGLAWGMSKLDGGTENDVLDGGPGIDRLNGFYGEDVIRGNGGDDILETGANADGADTLSGGPGVDAVSYLPRTAGVSMTLDGRANDGETGEGDNVGKDVEDLTGSKGDDKLVGNGRANSLRGLDGNDVMHGRGGDDRLEGDAGNDTLTGAAGVDAMYGATGQDRFNAKDGAVDLVDGGADPDTCTCDPDDILRSLP